MEQTKLKKRKLKWKILSSITIFVAIAMAASALVGYLYFERIVRSQAISDERVKQQQVASQSLFLTEDIDHFAKSIIVDDILQNILEDVKQEDSFENIRKKDQVSKRLAFYNSLKSYVASSFLELENGDSYSSSFSASEEDYLERKFSVEEFAEYREDDSLVYSKPYIGLESRITSPVVCYRTKIWSQNEYGKQQGTLYVEVYVGALLETMEVYGQDYENVCLMGASGEILFVKDEDGKIQDDIGKNRSVGENDIWQTKDGYLICYEVGDIGWILYTLITKERLWSQSHFVLNFFVFTFVMVVGLILLFTSRTLEKRIRPIVKLSEQMGKLQYDSMDALEIVKTGDEIQTLYECYQVMIIEIQRGIEKRIAYEKQKKEMEFDIMLSQVNPHYLYNVLNTVVYLAAAEHNQKIVELVQALIYTLQETLNLGAHHIETTVAKELELTRYYLQIQEYRYPEMFEVQVGCPKELKGFQILKTSIQPLVENALLHGVLTTGQKGHIWITVEKKGTELWVKVRDDGQGISCEILRKFQNKQKITYTGSDRKHIGISNIRDRIEYLYGEPYGMEIRKLESKGTEVVMCLPAVMPENGGEEE